MTASTGDPKPCEVRSHPDCLLHVPGLGHPESPERLEAVLAALEPAATDGWILRREVPLPARGDVLGALRWCHTAEHLEKVRQASENAPGWVDTPDCAVSAGSWRAATTAAGVALSAALDLVNRRIDRAFLAVRPPAHLAMRDAASGYCLLNHVAMAVEVAVRSWSAPVLVVDIDALHGRGLQSMFVDRAEVGFVSVHRYPGFPGTGGGDEVGVGAGEGTTLNVPLVAGSPDEIVVPATLEAAQRMARRLLTPAVMVIAAGFDAHVDDPVGSMAMTEDGFRSLSRGLVEIAERWCNGRVLSFLEGGFEPVSLANSTRVHVEELSQWRPQDAEHHGPVN
jgi:acetoin utilization deacetylase AcuC-like enzyme